MTCSYAINVSPDIRRNQIGQQINTAAQVLRTQRLKTLIVKRNRPKYLLTLQQRFETSSIKAAVEHSSAEVRNVKLEHSSAEVRNVKYKSRCGT